MVFTGKGIVFFQLAATASALHIEVDTNLHHSRGSVLKAAKRNFGVVSNTKKGAVKELDAMIEGMTNAKHGLPPVKRYPGGAWLHAAYMRGYDL